MAPVLGYWKIRGLAQPIRLLLHYVGQEFEDKLYEQGDGPEFSREVWLKEKHSLGLALPNLPYYIDGDLKLTESNAILYHLGRKHDLVGGTEHEKAVNDMLMSMQIDLRRDLVSIAYNPNFETLKVDFLNNAPAKFKLLSGFLGEKKWFAGDKLTTSDFCLYELLDIHRILEPSLVTDNPNLVAYCERFQELPGVKEYLATPAGSSLPLNNKIAKWGNA